MSDRPNLSPNRNADDTPSPGARKLMSGLSTVNRVLTVWVPGALAVVALAIGIATSSVPFIAAAVVLGVIVAYAWVRSLGTRDTPNGN